MDWKKTMKMTFAAAFAALSLAMPQAFAAEEPAIRCSICTGEQVAGFRDRRTGHFREVTLIKTPKDLETFKKDYGVEDLKKIF